MFRHTLTLFDQRDLSSDKDVTHRFAGSDKRDFFFRFFSYDLTIRQPQSKKY